MGMNRSSSEDLPNNNALIVVNFPNSVGIVPCSWLSTALKEGIIKKGTKGVRCMSGKVSSPYPQHKDVQKSKYSIDLRPPNCVGKVPVKALPSTCSKKKEETVPLDMIEHIHRKIHFIPTKQKNTYRIVNSSRPSVVQFRMVLSLSKCYPLVGSADNQRARERERARDEIREMVNK